MFNKFSSRLPREKSKKELEQHYKDLELERGDLAAMLIAAFITFAPIVVIISLVYIGVAYIFGL